MTDFNKAFHDPRGSYNNPQEVIDDTSITKTQKIQVLKQWEYDARLLSMAEEENMPGDSSNMLSRIHHALRELGAKADS